MGTCTCAITARPLSLLLIAASGLIATASTASAALVYTNNFESGAGAEWSHTNTTVSPTGARTFLGQFGNDTVTLTLNSIPQPGLMRVSFDFYAIGTWDGNAAPGPDLFEVDVLGGAKLLSATFAVGDVHSTRMQSFPATEGLGGFPNRTGATENNTLGYWVYGYPRDAVWSLSFDFTATGPDLVINWRAMGLQQMSDESWGIDNVTIATVVPSPGPLALAGLGGALALRRRRR